MHTQCDYPSFAEDISRRGLLQTRLAAGFTVSVLPLSCATTFWGAEAAPPKHGAILCARLRPAPLRPLPRPQHQDQCRSELWPQYTGAASIRGEATPAISRGMVECSLPVDQLGAGATYYRRDPKAAEELLAEAGFPKGFKTRLTAISGLGRDLVDAVQLVQRYLKDVGIEADSKLQEYGACVATTTQGKYDGMVYGPIALTWEPDGLLSGRYMPGKSRHRGHVNDPTITAVFKEQRRTKALEAREQIIFEFQRYEAEQQYYVYANSNTITSTWPPHVKNYTPNQTFDYGSRVAALWLDR
jgi:ABC-type transport system substrate-binding protein